MRSTWRRFVGGDPVSAAAAATLLRGAFALLFGAQTAIALLIGAGVAWLTDAPGEPARILGIVLVILGIVQGPAGLAAGLAPLPGADEARTASIQRTLLAAVLLSTPAWYLAFLIATGGGGWPLLALIALLAVYWLAGILLATRLGARAAST